MASIFPSRRFVTNASLSTNLVVDGSVTPVPYTIAPTSGTLFTVYQLIFNAYGTGNIAQPTEFWNFPALPNGISNQIQLNGILATAPAIIKTNFDLIQYLGGEFLGKSIGANNIIRGQFDMNPPLTLNGNRGDYFRIIVNDDLTVGGHIGQMNIALRGSTITF